MYWLKLRYSLVAPCSGSGFALSMFCCLILVARVLGTFYVPLAQHLFEIVNHERAELLRHQWKVMVFATGNSNQRAMEIATGALAKVREIGCKPMTIAVVDAGDCLTVLMREDGSGVLRPDIAFAKAWGVVGMGIGGRAMSKRASDTPQFWAALNTISNGRIAPVAGGVLTLQAGQVMGGAGMSGDLLH